MIVESKIQAMSKKSILIGSNGYLGKHLALHLKNEGFENSNFDIHPEAVQDVSNYKQLDITKENEFTKLDPETDFIFLFAGLTGTANGFEKYNDFVQVNEIGLLNLLTWMRQTKSKARIIFPSTRLVYKGVKNTALKESDTKEALTLYAANKLNGENLLWMYQNAFGIDYTIFRICVPYGNLFDDEFSYGTLGFFINKAKNKQNISLYGDGKIGRTFSHVSDISSIIIQAIQTEATKNEVYNIGGENMQLLDVATILAKKYGVDVELSDWPEMALKLESGDTIFDDTKLRSTIAFEYKHTIKDWLSTF